MKFSLPEGTTVIAYTGTYNGVPLHTTAKAVADTLGDGVRYISNLPAGTLLNRQDFKNAMIELVGEEKSVISYKKCNIANLSTN